MAFSCRRGGSVHRAFGPRVSFLTAVSIQVLLFFLFKLGSIQNEKFSYRNCHYHSTFCLHCSWRRLQRIQSWPRRPSTCKHAKPYLQSQLDRSSWGNFALRNFNGHWGRLVRLPLEKRLFSLRCHILCICSREKRLVNRGYVHSPRNGHKPTELGHESFMKAQFYRD